MNDMKLSDIIRKSDQQFGIKKILEDREFETLGLAGTNIDLKFCTFIEDEKYIDILPKNATMVITKADIARKIGSRGVCISENPKVSYFSLHNYLAMKDEYNLCIKFKTQIGENCNISDLAYVSDKNVKIGNNVTIEEFVSVKENTVIGDNTIIRSGTVLGSEGYEFKRFDNKVLSVKHIGWVEIGEHVEIQHNTCVDKAIYPWDRTRIGDYSKIDNLVHIAHGVKLDKGVFVVAGALIGGRTEIKENTWVGVGTTVSNGLFIDKEASLNIGSVVTKDVDESQSVSGNFAIEHKKFIEFIKSIR